MIIIINPYLFFWILNLSQLLRNGVVRRYGLEEAGYLHLCTVLMFVMYTTLINKTQIDVSELVYDWVKFDNLFIWFQLL